MSDNKVPSRQDPSTIILLVSGSVKDEEGDRMRMIVKYRRKNCRPQAPYNGVQNREYGV